MHIGSRTAVVAAAVASACFAGNLTPVVEWSHPLPVTAVTAGSLMVPPCPAVSGYAVAGSCRDTSIEAQSEQLFLVITDSLGKTERTCLLSSFDRSETGAQTVNALLRFPGGGFILAGTRTRALVSGNDENAWVARTDSLGNAGRMTVFAADKRESSWKVRCASLLDDGSVLVGGSRGDSAWIGCVDDKGAIAWSRTFDGASVLSLSRFADGSIVAAFLETGLQRNWIVARKVNCAGTDAGATVSVIAWGSDNADTPLVAPLARASTILAFANHATNSCSVLRYGEGGATLWEQDVYFMRAYSFSVGAITPSLTDGCFLGGGFTYGSIVDNQPMWIAKLSSDGEIDWQWHSTMAQSVLAVAQTGENDLVALVENRTAREPLLLVKLHEKELPGVGIAARPVTRTVGFGSGTAEMAFDLRGRRVGSGVRGLPGLGVYAVRSGNGSSRIFKLRK